MQGSLNEFTCAEMVRLLYQGVLVGLKRKFESGDRSDGNEGKSTSQLKSPEEGDFDGGFSFSIAVLEGVLWVLLGVVKTTLSGTPYWRDTYRQAGD